MAVDAVVVDDLPGTTSSDKLEKVIGKIKQSDKSLAAANELIKLENADKRSDALVSKFTKESSQMNSTERAELAGYLRVYAAEMEKEYSTTVSQELVKGVLSGQACAGLRSHVSSVSAGITGALAPGRGSLASEISGSKIESKLKSAGDDK